MSNNKTNAIPVNFKLKDQFKAHTSVNVAGTFNDWNPKLDSLEFNDKDKAWMLELFLDLPEETKIMYKYVVDDTNWICDESEPFEADENGFNNNVAILKSFGAELHENELFDPSEQDNNSETAPTSGEDDVIVEHAQTQTHAAVTSSLSKPEDKTPEEVVERPSTAPATINKEDEQEVLQSFWESIKFFFKYYILSWFYPERR
jgi:hypothetical protein